MEETDLKSFAKSTAILIVGVGLAGVLNYVFNIFVGRSLGPAQYSGFVSILSILYIFSIPALTIQTTAAKFSAEKRSLAAYLLQLVLYLIVPTTILLCLASPTISNILKISNVAAVVLGMTSLLPALVVPIVLGELQGEKSFVRFSIVNLVSPVLKLALCVAIIPFGLTLTHSVAAVTISFFLALGFGLLLHPIKKDSQPISKETTSFIHQYLKTATVAFACYTVLVNIDILAAKYFLSAEMAGNYAAVSTLGKTLLFITQPITWVMFPIITGLVADDKKHYRYVLLTLAATGAIAGLLYIATLAWSNQIVSLAFGPKYTFATSILPQFTLAMFFYALTNVWLNYYLAVHKKWLGFTLTVSVILEAVLLALFHQTILQIVDSVTIVMAATFITLSVLYLVPKLLARQQEQSA